MRELTLCFYPTALVAIAICGRPVPPSRIMRTVRRFNHDVAGHLVVSAVESGKRVDASGPPEVLARFARHFRREYPTDERFAFRAHLRAVRILATIRVHGLSTLAGPIAAGDASRSQAPLRV